MPLPPGLSNVVVILYLHGFASSSRSSKAAFFAEKCRQHGLTFRCPDLNEPDFHTLTMTRMLQRVEAEIDEVDEATVTLVGSSLGGTLAVLAAERLADRIDQVVLMAPAVMFTRPGHHLLSPEKIEEWRSAGSWPFFHYAYGEERTLAVDFHEDSLRHDPFTAQFAQPTLVFQGQHDVLVNPQSVEDFAASRRNVTLTLLDDDHQLIKSLPRIWSEVEAFLGLID